MYKNKISLMILTIKYDSMNGARNCLRHPRRDIFPQTGITGVEKFQTSRNGTPAFGTYENVVCNQCIIELLVISGTVTVTSWGRGCTRNLPSTV